MDIFQSIILGIVQGITEFLPISSSGHLVLFQKLFGMQEPPIFFDTLIHFATILAVVFYLRKEIWSILKGLNRKENQRLVTMLFLATIPAVIVGFSIKDEIDEIFNSLSLLAISFLITSFILFLTKFFEKDKKDMVKITWVDSLFVGIFQALAILPGVSRSGSTISAGLFRGLDRISAFKFSFLMAVPVILGAMVLQLAYVDINSMQNNLIQNFLGFTAALISGFLSLKLLEIITVKGKFHYFSFYCLALALVILITL